MNWKQVPKGEPRNWNIEYGLCDGTGPFFQGVLAKDMLTAIRIMCERFSLTNANLISVMPDEDRRMRDLDPLSQTLKEPTDAKLGYNAWRRETFPTVDWDGEGVELGEELRMITEWIEYLHGIDGDSEGGQ